MTKRRAPIHHLARALRHTVVGAIVLGSTAAAAEARPHTRYHLQEDGAESLIQMETGEEMVKQPDKSAPRRVADPEVRKKITTKKSVRPRL